MLYICLNLALQSALALDSIGVAAARGAFRVSGSAAFSVASLPAGAVIETDAVPSRLLLHSGAKIDLGTGSRVQVFQDRLVLERGSAEAVGRMTVETADGRLLARLSHAQPLAFAMPDQLSAITQVTGLVEVKEGELWITDELSSLRFKLSGEAAVTSKIQSLTGKRVTIDGQLQKDGAVIEAVQVKAAPLAPATTTAPAGTAKAGTKAAAGAAKTAGAISGTKAVILGVSIAAAGTGATLGIVEGTSSRRSTTISQ
jgi:hypothetical protein